MSDASHQSHGPALNSEPCILIFTECTFIILKYGEIFAMHFVSTFKLKNLKAFR